MHYRHHRNTELQRGQLDSFAYVLKLKSASSVLKLRIDPKNKIRERATISWRRGLELAATVAMP